MLFCILSLTISATAALDFAGQGVHKETLDNLVFGDETLITEKYPFRSVTACALLCWKHVECMSFAVKINTGKCRLYKSAGYRKKDGTAQLDWKYYVFGDTKCPLKNGFVYSRVHKLCIHWSKDTFLYQSGKQYCSEKGANLISLDTAEKVNAVSDMLSLQPAVYSFFIGLTFSNGQWRWGDGKVLGPEANWGKNRPRSGNGYECAHAVRNSNYKYEDHACYAYPTLVVCEHN